MSLSEADSAPQHGRGPRPLPLFLEMVRLVATEEPETAQAAIRGLAAYERAQRPLAPAPKPEIGRVGAASLRDHGGDGRPVVLVPSLINPPHILDLDEEVSLAGAIAAMGRRTLLLDWGEARGRPGLDAAGHVEALLLPLLRELGEPAALVGYCLGGTMAIAAANLAPVERVVTLAAPWHFGGYSDAALESLARIWSQSRRSAEQLGALPMEVLQAAFWSIDPTRTVAKFADFAALEPGSTAARRFVALEDWANQGEPLPFPAARELIEDLFGADLPGNGGWRVGGRPASDRVDVPVLHCTASRDRIAPAATAPAGAQCDIAAGHVGMIVGSARHQLHAVLEDFLVRT